MTISKDALIELIDRADAQDNTASEIADSILAAIKSNRRHSLGLAAGLLGRCRNDECTSDESVSREMAGRKTAGTNKGPGETAANELPHRNSYLR